MHVQVCAQEEVGLRCSHTCMRTHIACMHACAGMRTRRRWSTHSQRRLRDGGRACVAIGSAVGRCLSDRCRWSSRTDRAGYVHVHPVHVHTRCACTCTCTCTCTCAHCVHVCMCACARTLCTCVQVWANRLDMYMPATCAHTVCMCAGVGQPSRHR